MVETPPSFAINCFVRLQVGGQDELRGKIFAVDPLRRALVLQVKGERHNTFDFTIVNTDTVTQILEAIPPENIEDHGSEALPVIDQARTDDRYQRAIRDAHQDAQRIGVGVTRKGQEIYDAIAKTLPCRWRDKDIVVLDEIVVREPYTVDSTDIIPDGDPRLLDRVRLVINSENDAGGQ